MECFLLTGMDCPAVCLNLAVPSWAMGCVPHARHSQKMNQSSRLSSLQRVKQSETETGMEAVSRECRALGVDSVSGSVSGSVWDSVALDTRRDY